MTPQKVKITKVFKSDKGKDGKAFVSKNGKPFWKVGILTDRTGEEWYSTVSFRNDSAEMNLKEGDEVAVIFETNGQYKNFKIPSRLDLLELRVQALENGTTTPRVTDSDTREDYPDGPDPANIPF